MAAALSRVSLSLDGVEVSSIVSQTNTAVVVIADASLASFGPGDVVITTVDSSNVTARAAFSYAPAQLA